MLKPSAITLLLAALWQLSPPAALAQSFRLAGTEFNAMRSVTMPAGRNYSIVVVEFLHHGEIRPDGGNLIVVASNRQQVPLRILQLGPGDFCRLAFQTLKNQTDYDIFYGGEPPREPRPAWTREGGLLLETRQFRSCNFGRFESVRDAFESATPIGADYVDGVFHSDNPFSLKREPFLSRYRGSLQITKPGTYGFFTSSQDCSFLLIDGRVVAAAPGHHGPTHRAWRGTRHDVELSAGEHRFEYYHAAAGPHAIMVAAWEINPASDKPEQPQLISPEAFKAHVAGHLAANDLVFRTSKLVPDFTVRIAGDVPLPDNDVPLIGVLFRDLSPKALTMPGAKIQWDFGDGQTSNLANADHIYLRPGLYRVTLSIRRGGKTTEITNRISVDRPRLAAQERPHAFGEYMKILETYNVQTLDAASLRQLTLAYEARSLAVDNRAEDLEHRARQVAEDPNRRPDAKRKGPQRPNTSSDLNAEAVRYLEKAVAAGSAAFGEGSAATDSQELLPLAQLIGPMARIRLGDSEKAFAIWHAAAQRIESAEAKAECQLMAADIALNDLLDPGKAKPLLDAAAKRRDKGSSRKLAIALARVQGDYYAMKGDRVEARNAYHKAETLAHSERFAERAARQGAHARSTEEFLKQKDFARAREELEAWQQETPVAKLEGYLNLLLARYWAGRGKYAQAIAQAERLQTANPESPYLDQLLLIAADSEMRRGRKDRAVATLHSLLKECPGSPLAPLAKKNIDLLGAGNGERQAGQ